MVNFLLSDFGATMQKRTIVLGVLVMAVQLTNMKPAEAIEFGWQPLAGGGVEYLVQVEPDLIEDFRKQGFASEIPPNLRDVRRIRIVVGKEKLPNQSDLNGPSAAQGSVNGTDSKAGDQKSAAVPANPSDSDRVAAKDTTPTPETSAANRDRGTLPLLHPDAQKYLAGQGRNIPAASENPSDSGRKGMLPIPNNLPGDSIRSPRIESDEPLGQPAATPGGHQTFDAAKPDTSGSAIGIPGGNSSGPAEAKPWLPMIAALLALFCSLGANVYLVWIHQAMRVRYRELLSRFGRGVAGAA